MGGSHRAAGCCAALCGVVLLLFVHSAAFAQNRGELVNVLQKIPRYLGFSSGDLSGSVHVSVDFRRDSVVWARAAAYPFAAASTVFYLYNDRVNKIECTLAKNTLDNMNVILTIYEEAYGPPDTVIGDSYFWTYSREADTIIIEIAGEQTQFANTIFGRWYYKNY